MKRILVSLLLALTLLLTLIFGAFGETADIPMPITEFLAEDGVIIADELVLEYGCDYTDPSEVALYLHVFRELPPNFLTKAEAQEYGWKGGDLWRFTYLYGLSIGGDRFGNREGLLPKAKGRQWYECDVNYVGGSRGAERLLYASDGLIYYTGDHYATFSEFYDGWYEEELQ